ncbi:MAG: hypothetical protein IJW23_02145 [Lentisphaeria bacterium]|nr:hypothetical protein [Lentisphaeria bacterium]
MFKKLIVAMLILGFASAVPVMAQGAKVPAINKADLSSKDATVKTFVLSVFHGKVDIMWECFAPAFKKQIEQVAKQQNKSLAEIKKFFCQEMQKGLKSELDTKYKGDINKLIADITKGAPLININGKWYINLP